MPNESEHQPSSRWQFNPCCTSAYDGVCAAFTRFVAPRDDDAPAAVDDVDYPAVAEGLGHGSVAPAVAKHVLEDHDGYVAHLASFAAHVAYRQPEATGPAQLVLALAEEARGNVLAAEAALRTAVDAAPGYGPASSELARYAIDRGDLTRAIALLRHPQLAHDHTILHLLEGLQREIDAPYARLGRNDMCPCRSGRKYKTCCLGEEKVLPGLQAGLVLHKVTFYVRHESRRYGLPDLAAATSAQFDASQLANADGLSRDPLLCDFAMFEGGGATSFLHIRGTLLPDEERDLLDELVKTSRRLWRLVDVHAATTIGLNDTATGEMAYVPMRPGMDRMAVDDLLLARVARLPDGDEILGIAVEVPAQMYDTTANLLVTGPDATELAAWYGQRLALHATTT
jgi:hypothetical protein